MNQFQSVSYSYMEQLFLLPDLWSYLFKLTAAISYEDMTFSFLNKYGESLGNEGEFKHFFISKSSCSKGLWFLSKQLRIMSWPKPGNNVSV